MHSLLKIWKLCQLRCHRKYEITYLNLKSHLTKPILNIQPVGWHCLENDSFLIDNFLSSIELSLGKRPSCRKMSAVNCCRHMRCCVLCFVFVLLSKQQELKGKMTTNFFYIIGLLLLNGKYYHSLWQEFSGPCWLTGKYFKLNAWFHTISYLYLKSMEKIDGHAKSCWTISYPYIWMLCFRIKCWMMWLSPKLGFWCNGLSWLSTE